MDFKYFVAKYLRFMMPKEKRRIWRGQLAAMKITTLIENGKERKPKFEELRGITVLENGTDNKIIMQMPRQKLHLSAMIFGNHNIIEIGKQVTGDLIIKIPQGNGSHISVGDECILGCVKLHVYANGSIRIGKECMIASVEVWASDGHCVLDATTKRVVNTNSNEVIIGDHCWIGAHSFVFKNAFIPNHTIVGFGSLVTKKFTEEYTVLGGNPAKVLKAGLDWDSRTIEQYKEQVENLL